MKKQILFLAFLVLATLASVNQAFAQATPHDAPTCTASALNPAAGELYTYEVEIPNTGGYTGTGTYDWYVMTQGQLDLLNGTHISPASNAEFIAEGHYDTPTADANTIGITWSSAALATGQPYFLVVVYEETLACTSNNIKVYRIEPKNAFWLKIDNVTTSVCAAPVSSAIITDTGDPGTIEYLYGTNTLQFTITASGYEGDFDGTVRLAGFEADQAVSAAWTSASGGSGTLTSPGTANGDYTGTLPSTVAGELITVTLTVVNNHFENLAGQTIDIAIDGSYTSGASTFNDLSDVNGSCTAETAFADATTQDITARPTVNPVVGPTFVPQVAP
ncbi:MAG: hypothetical protein AB7U05_07090 [Mangrovibacterium sp.]